LRALIAIAAVLSLILALSLPAGKASAPMSKPLEYTITIEGSASGNCSSRLRLEVDANITVSVGPGGEEVAVPRTRVSTTYSGSGACGTGNCSCSISAIEVALNASKEFVVDDPVLGVLQPYFTSYLSQVPCLLNEAACCGGAGNVTEHGVSASAVLTTYEGRDAVEYMINYSAAYSSGRESTVVTEAVVDLATLEPLALNSSTTVQGSGCVITTGFTASLKNPGDLPTGWVSEARVTTTAGDALIVVGGAKITDGPKQVGEGRVGLILTGSGRAVVVVAYPPSLGEVDILSNASGTTARVYRFGAGSAYAIKTINLGGSARVELVFGNASVAVPLTASPPGELLTTSPQLTTSPSALPYVLGAVVVAVVGGAALAIIRARGRGRGA